MSDENTEASDGPAWGYHPKEGAKIFADGVLPDGWSDTPVAVEDPKDALREEAEALGITVDGRWSVERLQQEIDDAKAADDGDSA